MAFPQEPLNPLKDPVDRVRILVGDIDPLDIELSYEMYEYFLLIKEGNENEAAIAAINALVARYAKAMEEDVDGVSAKWKQRYEGYKEQIEVVRKEIGTYEIYAGGLSRQERICDRWNNDLRDSTITVGQSTGRFTELDKNRSGFYYR